MIRSSSVIFGVMFIVVLPLELFADSEEISADVGDIVASDFAEMQEYAQAQYEHLLTELEVASSLTDEHKELVATALSKNLEGLPICSFNQEIVYTEETDTDVTFQFRFDKKAKSSSENITELLRDLRRVAKNLRYEFKVDIQSGAPKSLVLELIKPTRVFVVARVKKIRYASLYKFDESMQRHVIPEQSVEYTASAPIRGTETEKIDVIHSNFECSTPIRYVWHASGD